MNTGQTIIQNERIVKPQVVIDNNRETQDIDLSDQISAYYTWLGRPIKWHSKVAFELIFGNSTSQ